MLACLGVRETDLRSASIDPAAARGRPAPLHRDAPVGEATALDLHLDVPEPALGDAALQAPATLGVHAAFDAMAKIGALRVHVTNLWPVRDSCQPL